MDAWIGRGGTYRVPPNTTMLSCLCAAFLLIPGLLVFVGIIGLVTYPDRNAVTLVIIGAVATIVPTGLLVLHRRRSGLYLDAWQIGYKSIRGYPIAWCSRDEVDRVHIDASGQLTVVRRNGTVAVSIAQSVWRPEQAHIVTQLVRQSFTGSKPSPDGIGVQNLAERVLHFREKDLAANRRGVMTGYQVLRLCEREAWWSLWLLLSVLVIVAIGAYLVYGALWWAAGRAILVILLLVLFIIQVAPKALNVGRDAVSRKVIAGVGDLTMHPVDSKLDRFIEGSSIRYRLKADSAKSVPGVSTTGEIEFTLPPAAPVQLPEVVRGIAYFAPRSRRLLALDLSSGIPSSPINEAWS
jgi:hypothetical protein